MIGRVRLLSALWSLSGGGGQRKWCVIEGWAALVRALVAKSTPGDAHWQEGRPWAQDGANCVHDGAHEGRQAQQQAGQEGGTGSGQDGRLMICCIFTCNAMQERERERERCNKLWLSFLENCYYGCIHRWITSCLKVVFYANCLLKQEFNISIIVIKVNPDLDDTTPCHCCKLRSTWSTPQHTDYRLRYHGPWGMKCTGYVSDQRAGYHYSPQCYKGPEEIESQNSKWLP